MNQILSTKINLSTETGAPCRNPGESAIHALARHVQWRATSAGWAGGEQTKARKKKTHGSHPHPVVRSRSGGRSPGGEQRGARPVGYGGGADDGQRSGAGA